MLNTFKNKFIAAATLLAASTAVYAAPTDLSTWSAQGGSSSWNVQSGNDTALQLANGEPTIFFDSSSTRSQGTALNGKIKINSTSDDDFISFVLSYDSGEISSSSSNFFLVDWKQGNKNYLGNNGEAGLAISHITPLIYHPYF